MKIDTEETVYDESNVTLRKVDVPPSNNHEWDLDAETERPSQNKPTS